MLPVIRQAVEVKRLQIETVMYKDPAFILALQKAGAQMLKNGEGTLLSDGSIGVTSDRITELAQEIYLNSMPIGTAAVIREALAQTRL
jgi:hypothetical protein